MVRLGVNIDHVATLRQQRHGMMPDPVYAALTAEAHGADGIVAHLREDRRHIQERDVRLLRQTLQTRLALEMAATSAMESIALDILPQRVCLVPEKRQELTTEGGLDVVGNRIRIKKIISRLSAKKIEVSLFIDPDTDQIKCARSLGADAVELHTGRYADAAEGPKRDKEFTALLKASDVAVKFGPNCVCMPAMAWITKTSSAWPASRAWKNSILDFRSSAAPFSPDSVRPSKK